MAEVKQGAGFRYTKIMAWGPVILLAFAMVTIYQGFTMLGIVVAICGVLFGLIVKRRQRAQIRAQQP